MDKFAGALAGVRAAAGAGDEVDAEEAAATTGVEELLTLADGRVLKAALGRRGTVEWAPLSESQREAELRRVVAQSQMASMLKDARRNGAYAAAIGGAIAGFAAAAGRPPVVLDVGAGTGLLSMLAAAAGAARVTAVEQWPVMAAIAREVVERNRAAGALPPACAIDVLAQRSFDVTVPADMPVRADVVVSEILDSALLGEGIVESLRHAFQHLAAAPGGVAAAPPACVPLRGTLHAQLVSSSLLAAWHNTSRAQLRPGVPLRVQRGAAACRASPPTIPVHAARLQPPPVPLSSPFVVCELDFSPAGLSPQHRAFAAPHVLAVPASAGTPASAVATTAADALVFWWDVTLWEGVRYSTAPPAVCQQQRQDHQQQQQQQQGLDADSSRWQDHWVQCVVPLPQPVPPSEDPATGRVGWTVVASVSDLRVDFVVGAAGATVWPTKRAHSLAVKAAAAAAGGAAQPPLPPRPPAVFVEPELCSCGLHRTCTHERRWLLSEPTLGWAAAVASAVDATLSRAQLAPGARVLCLGEGSLCALAAASSPFTRTRDSGGGGSGGGAPITLVAVESTAVAQHHAETLAGAALQQQHAHDGGGARGSEEAAAAVVMRVVLVPPTECLVGSLPALLANDDDDDDDDGDDRSDSVDGVPGCEGESDEPETGAVVAGVGGDGGLGLPASAHEDEGVEAAGGGEAASPPPLPAFSAVLAEPYFATLVNAPLWTAAHLWRRFGALAGHPAFERAFAERAVMPLRAALRCQLVAFARLHATHGPVGSPCGFDHAPFDAIEAGYAQHAFAYPLWQYEHTAVGAAATLLELDYAAAAGGGGAALSGAVVLTTGGGGGGGGCAPPPNAVCCWVDYELAPGCWVSTGPAHHGGGAPTPWRQAVLFLGHGDPRVGSGGATAVRVAAALGAADDAGGGGAGGGGGFVVTAEAVGGG